MSLSPQSCIFLQPAGWIAWASHHVLLHLFACWELRCKGTQHDMCLQAGACCTLPTPDTETSPCCFPLHWLYHCDCRCAQVVT